MNVLLRIPATLLLASLATFACEREGEEPTPAETAPTPVVVPNEPPAGPVATPALAPVATPAPTPAPKPVVVIVTTTGTIEVGLDPENAPVTVRNFLEYVRGGFYNGTIFHRADKGFVIQGGGYLPGMEPKETREPIANESKNGLGNLRGTIAMARQQDPNSATSQFYINIKDNFALDPKPGRAGYTVFGQVISGMDVADRINQAATNEPDTVPLTPIVIESMYVRGEVAAPASAPPAITTPTATAP